MEKDEYGCPSPTATMKEKQTREYGGRYAKHIWSSYWRTGAAIGAGQWARYQYLRDVSLGRKSMESVMGYLYNIGPEATQGHTYFDVQTLNMAPRFINTIKTKLSEVSYDPSVTAIDPLSVDSKKDFERKLKAWTVIKSEVEELSPLLEEMMPRMPEGWEPSSVEEANIYMQVSHKTEDEIKAELSIKSDLEYNNYEEVANRMADDLVILDIAACRTWIDGNMNRKIKWCDPARMGFSIPVDETFENIQYAFEVEYLTVEHFRMEASGYLTGKEIEEVVRQAAGANNYGKFDYRGFQLGSNGNDGKMYIPVIKFEFITPDKRVYVKKTNKYGRTVYDRKSDDYRPGVSYAAGREYVDQKEIDKFEKGEKELVEDNLRSVYGGTWVIGTDFCYNYGLLESGKSVTLGFHIFAPNMRNGATSSIVSQILEPLVLIDIAHNKVKEVIGKGYNGILNINFAALTGVSFGKGGASWTPQQVMDFFFQRQIGVHNTVQAGDGGTAFNIQNSGIDITHYIAMIERGIQYIIDITGVNPSNEVGTNISGESLQMSQMASNAAIGHLYNAMRQVFKKVAKELLRYNADFADESYMRQFIVEAKKTPTSQERAEFRAELSKLVAVPLEQGGITAADRMVLGNMHNLKQAELLCAYRTKRNMLAAQQRTMQTMQQQGQINDQNVMATAQAKIEEYKQKIEADMRYREFDSQMKRQEIALQGKLAMDKEQISNMIKLEISKQTNTASIVKEATRSQSDRETTAMKNENDLLKHAVSVENEHLLQEKEHEHELRKPVSEKKAA